MNSQYRAREERTFGKCPSPGEYVPVNLQYNSLGVVTCDCVTEDASCLTDKGDNGPSCLRDTSCAVPWDPPSSAVALSADVGEGVGVSVRVAVQKLLASRGLTLECLATPHVRVMWAAPGSQGHALKNRFYA